MKKKLTIALIALSMVTTPTIARADMFGADLLFLGALVSNALEQLAQLKDILGAGQDSLDFVRNLNEGINDSLNLLRTLNRVTTPGIYGNWRSATDALMGINQLYGAAVDSPDAKVQNDTDQSVAEAIALNNSVYDYTSDIDQVGENIKSYSHSVSPGGAQKLTAQGIGVMLNVMNESLRTQATHLKLEAQSVAVENKKDKERSKEILGSADSLANAMRDQPTTFDLIRF